MPETYTYTQALVDAQTRRHVAALHVRRTAELVLDGEF